MKILLIKPPEKEVYTKVPTIAGIAQPMGLACIAAYARENGFKDISILDCEALQIGVNEIKEHIPKDVKVVGLTSVTPTLKNAAAIMKAAKELNPSCITVLGGDHVTALPEETLEAFPEIDFGVFGEGEVTFLELLNELKKKEGDFSKIKGLAYRENGKVKKNAARPLMEDINILPIPAYDLLPMKKYSPPAHHAIFTEKGVRLNPFTIFFSLRGCPYRCKYCASKVMWKRKVRYRSVEKTMEEVDYLIKNYGIKCLEFNDENFIINKPRMNEIIRELKIRKEKHGVYWNCLTRVDSVDEQTLRVMKEAGCYFIRFGVESGDPEILKGMSKDITIKQIKHAFALTNKAGIACSASFIIGYPGETKETFRRTLNLAKEIDPTLAFFFIAIPIVGTELYKEAKEKNLILNPDWNGWVQMAETPIMKTEELEPGEMIKMRNQAYKEFYLRPKYIWKMLRNIHTKEQFMFYVRGFLGVLNIIKR
ncbi:MAG: B12-binding domain-containing radical SAM protein [Nanoarchaeota archaeon]|nr:B12-binding domain-containing radical SAM protein [Nanoarchaeota archaeon]